MKMIQTCHCERSNLNVKMSATVIIEIATVAALSRNDIFRDIFILLEIFINRCLVLKALL